MSCGLEMTAKTIPVSAKALDHKKSYLTSLDSHIASCSLQSLLNTVSCPRPASYLKHGLFLFFLFSATGFDEHPIRTLPGKILDKAPLIELGLICSDAATRSAS